MNYFNRCFHSNFVSVYRADSALFIIINLIVTTQQLGTNVYLPHRNIVT